ncbi:MFS transporter [Occallatibacter savannae]|uniref:MFS transporter n=1 Tax=Occallatibacter savannae TaxID=1002691 RepID=UPI001EF5B8A9|nr:MFS transporter [Occallatibacter savannae]
MVNPTKPVDERTRTMAGEEVPALKGRWTICAMLFVATTINYVDRTVLSVLKPDLRGQVVQLHPLFPGWPSFETRINITDHAYGWILWAFQIAYALGVVFAGRLVDRMGCRKGYPLVTGLWSLAAMSHALVRSVAGFGVARFFLGLGESGNFPAAIKATAEWFPPRERSLATGIFNSGAGVGAIVAPVLVPWVAVHFGWRASFLVTGIFSLVWIVWWSIQYRKPSQSMDSADGPSFKAPNASEFAWWRLLQYRQAWAFMVGKFLTDAVWWFFLFWLPQYFHSRFSLDLTHMGLPLVSVYVVSTFGSVYGGWLPKGYTRLGMPLKKARLAAMLTCACCVLPVVTVGTLKSQWLAVGLLALAAAAHQGWSANIFTTVSDMFPSEHVGTVVSFGQVAGALGGAIFQPIAGDVLQRAKDLHTQSGFVPLFIYSGCAYLIALLLLRMLAPGLKRAELPSS